MTPAEAKELAVSILRTHGFEVQEFEGDDISEVRHGDFLVWRSDDPA